MTEQDISLLVSCTVSRTLKKGEQLLKEGEVCRAFYLVDSGYLRTWYNKNGIPINLHFTFEGGFTSNIQSVKSKKGSEFVIEAGEPASVVIFDLNRMHELSKQPSQISVFTRRLAIQLLLASEEHSNLFKMFTPTERYRYIEKNNPRLLQRISLSQISSYLGVTRETLSRIRSKNHAS